MKDNAIIFGDSYSTFRGYIPDGHAAYYSEDSRMEIGVTNVELTWWHQVVNEANLSLVLNDSWSGSTICYTGWNKVDCSASSSFIYRLETLIANGFFEKNDIQKVFVFGATNDNWCDAPLGDMKYADWEKSDLYSVFPAVCYFLHLLKQTLPLADIYCLINTDLKPEVVDCMLKACEAYDITPVTFDHIHKIDGHPTPQGMVDIKNRVLQAMKR